MLAVIGFSLRNIYYLNFGLSAACDHFIALYGCCVEVRSNRMNRREMIYSNRIHSMTSHERLDGIDLVSFAVGYILLGLFSPSAEEILAESRFFCRVALQLRNFKINCSYSSIVTCKLCKNSCELISTNCRNQLIQLIFALYKNTISLN